MIGNMLTVNSSLNSFFPSTLFPQMTTESVWSDKNNELIMKANKSASNLQSIFQNVSTFSSLNRSSTAAVYALAHSVSSGQGLLASAATSGPTRGELLNSLDSTEVYLVDDASAGTQTLVLCENLGENPQSKFWRFFFCSLLKNLKSNCNCVLRYILNKFEMSLSVIKVPNYSSACLSGLIDPQTLFLSGLFWMRILFILNSNLTCWLLFSLLLLGCSLRTCFDHKWPRSQTNSAFFAWSFPFVCSLVQKLSTPPTFFSCACASDIFKGLSTWLKGVLWMLLRVSFPGLFFPFFPGHRMNSVCFFDDVLFHAQFHYFGSVLLFN